MQGDGQVRVDGTVTGLPSVGAPVDWGPLRLWEAEGEVQFALAVNAADFRGKDVVASRLLVAAAVEAAIAAGVGAAARVTVKNFDHPDGFFLNIPVEFLVTAPLNGQPEAIKRAVSALEVVLTEADPRLTDLYRVYVLGLQAVQTIAPVVGLWAFTSILEEDSPDKQSLKHLEDLVASLTEDGYVLPPAPSRHHGQIRAAALHAAPKNPPPTEAEVHWFREVAHAYLLRRAQRAASL